MPRIVPFEKYAFSGDTGANERHHLTNQGELIRDKFIHVFSIQAEMTRSR
jgi:hypothetical protein